MGDDLGFDLEFSPAAARVCVVGAGVSGLCACRHLLKRGIRPTVLEGSSHIGGVWRSNSVAITRLQTPSVAYQFSDFPWPPGTPAFATGGQVLDYLHGYAAKFGVLECVRFDSRVVGIRRDGDRGPWQLLVERGDGDGAARETLEFDFVILCVGRFGDVPRLPSFSPGQGADVFKGRVLHSTEFSALDSENASKLLRGNSVVVVGFSKSALDVAAEAVEANQGKPCTLLFRRAHWIVQHWDVFGVNIAYLFGTRLSEMYYHKPGQGFFSSLLTSLLWPLKWATSKVVEVYLRWTLSLSKYGILPSIPFYKQLSSCKISVIPDNFMDYVKEGRLKLCKSPKWHFTATGVMLDNKRELKADVVLLCTGFEGEVKLKAILPERYAEVLQGPDGVVPLYRGMIHPRIPGMAILGYQEDVSNVRASEMGARWLSYYLTGKVKLPDSQTMSKSANEWVRYMKWSTPYFDRACVALARTWHSDELCRDIGWNPRRKKNWLQELLSPYSNMDYID
ncbi:hypothetical protein SELMODRAFT_408854 [Selaginella moellendorffii]|uniref:Flavin-containing monooxygenase n=1 Tax=Selaginella moellendorffii TaxID=88036 RepID=D8RA60_SELML|nr:probable flavin-containing monooxygenase 1 [Selaginella moellendorffii]XP_024528346.1 probable flavin-containing monooxygenase 1 [Selaginella moellendorffii]EFJ31272.1 hypothetical protein SELMODRAFT_408854 [Selaginella moellendorffii]|eukprot:XP_002967925.1 probable flavin-containing monooxygenase 1 [Selaginella moellendorffii]